MEMFTLICLFIIFWKHINLSDFIGSWLEQNFASGWIVPLISLILDLDITVTFNLELILEWVKTLGLLG